MASVKVAVRVRPFNQREVDMNAKMIIKMNEKKTSILNNKASPHDETLACKEFTFDYSYWSFDSSDENFASQEQVYNDLGTEVVDCAFEGYNACVFAYGQTGSGKTFTMMGSAECQGLIPRICKSLFSRMAAGKQNGTSYRTEVSYLEIYQERVMDLLRPQLCHSLRVREHPKKGPYVEDLTKCLVTDYPHIQDCMVQGNTHRTTASTNMNDTSSRSHAIFTITFVQASFSNGMPSETVSKIHLVDLAGSERANATGATGQRLKEGAHINKSLVTLGSVISALAETCSDKTKQVFIPYRNSVLTWLLKDSLGGNSKTIMIAAISPADCNYGETLSTLRYANRAKNIINKPTINEDPNVKLIRELREEINKLKALMFNELKVKGVEPQQVLAKLHQKEAQEKYLTEEWAEKWRETQEILQEQKTLGLRKSGVGVVLDSDRPHLVGIEDDVLSTGVVLYHLKEGETSIGTEDAEDKQDILVGGPGVETQHCSVLLKDGVVTLVPKEGAQCWVNLVAVDGPTRLSQGCLIRLGHTNMFRFNDPAEAAQLRKDGVRSSHTNLARSSLFSWSAGNLACPTENLAEGLRDRQRHLEDERRQLSAEMRRDCEHLIHLHRDIDNKLKSVRQFVVSNAHNIQNAPVLLQEVESIPDDDPDYLVNLLNEVEGDSVIVDMVNRHRKELTELQCELKRRRRSLSEHERRAEIVDKELIDTIDEQLNLNGTGENHTELEALKLQLTKRTHEQLREMAERKRQLSLDLKRAVDNNNSNDLTNTSETNETFHTADSSCFDSNCNGRLLPCQLMMSDSGLGLARKEDGDLSSSPGSSDSLRSAKRPLYDLCRRLAHQKALIVANLDTGCPKEELDEQIAILHELQKQYADLQRRRDSNGRALSPALTHPLEEPFSPSPSPLPLLSPYASGLTRSLPVLPLAEGETITVPGFVVRGSGSRTHCEYEVRLYCQGERWTVLRRYSRFRDLHLTMRKRFGDRVGAIPFPPRESLFAKFEVVASRRRGQLEMYLRRLLEVCSGVPGCPLHGSRAKPTRAALLAFSPFFEKGLFENGKHGTG